jgi:hypothetical protein
MPNIATKWLPALAAALWTSVAMAAQQQPAQAFVSETYVIVPKRIGAFVLEGTSYDPAEKYSGVGARYVDSDHEAIRVDLYVYPAGRMPQAEAVERGMTPFRESFDAGMRLGYYKQVEIDDDAPFAIPLRGALEAGKDAQAAAGDAPPAAVADAAPAAPTGRDLPDGLAKLLQPEPLRGRRLKMRYLFEPGDVPMRSRGYLFHKQLYFFKGRISAAESAVDEAEFSAFSDRAMVELVPAVEALNIGACGNVVVNVDSKTSKGGKDDDMARAMLEGILRTTSDNCSTAVPKDLDKRGENAEVVKIAYDPGDWNGP